MLRQRSSVSTLAKIQVSAFVRHRPLAAVALLTLGLAIAMSGRELWFALRGNVPIFDVLSLHTRYWIVWPLCLAALTFEVSSTPRRVGLAEALEAHPQTTHLHTLAMLVPELLLLTAVFIIYLGARVAIVFALGQQELVLGHIIAQTTLDLLVPSAIAVLVGLLAAQPESRLAGFATLALFAFVVGPYAQVVPAIAAYTTSVNIYDLYDMFQILPPDATWFIDPLYGFPIESQRWLVAGLWMGLLLALALPLLSPAQARGLRACRATLAAIAAALLLMALLPSSELRRDDRPFGGSTLLCDQFYYQRPGTLHQPKLRQPDFRVQRYEMRLTAGRELRAHVVVTIEDDVHAGVYRFTMYHGFRLSEVQGDDGRKLDFVRDGDYVIVRSVRDQRHLTFRYNGSGGRFVANRQCVFLPGYFPYFPIPGFLNLWDDVRSQLAPIPASVPSSDYHIVFEAAFPLTSSLEEHGGGFVGTSVAPSFVGGLAERVSVAGAPVVYYPAGPQGPERTRGMMTRLHDLRVSLGATSTPTPTELVVFELPGLAQFNGTAVVLSDAIFVSVIDESSAPDILVAGTPRRSDRENLKDAFAQLLGDPAGYAAAMSNQKTPTSSEVSNLEQARRSAAGDTERTQRYHYPARSAVYRLLYDKMLAEGASAALRSTYAYLASTDPRSELQYLTERSDRDAP